MASSKRGKNVSENAPCQKNNNSDNGEYWGGFWFTRFIVLAALYDKDDEGTKHDNDRECVCNPANDLCKWCGVHFWPRLAVRWQVSCSPDARIVLPFIKISRSQY
jgi:hypothetical protein